MNLKALFNPWWRVLVVLVVACIALPLLPLFPLVWVFYQFGEILTDFWRANP